MGLIVPYESIADIAKTYKSTGKIVLVSCPADPIHIGHVRYLKASAQFGSFLFVIVNGNTFLDRKKGYHFMDAQERAEIISELGFVSFVSVYDAEVQDVSDCILKIQPDVFCNGGDRKDDSTAPKCEIDACNQVGAIREYGVGGYTKLRSSSELVDRILRQKPVGELHQFSEKIHKLDQHLH